MGGWGKPMERVSLSNSSLKADAKAQARHQNMLRAGQVRDHALARKAAAAAKKEEDAHEDRVVGLLAQAGKEEGR